MTRNEFKSLVHQHQRGERFFGYIMFLSPLAVALWFLGAMVVDYINYPQTSILVWFAFIVTQLCAAFAWWGVHRIKGKFKDIIIITFDENQVTDRELINLIAEKMNCGKQNHESGLLLLRSGGWQTSYTIFIGSRTNEVFAEIRLSDNDGFFSWGIKKVQKRFVTAIDEIGMERSCRLTVYIDVN